MNIFSGCYHGKSLSTVLKSSSLLQECQNKALYSQTSAFKDRLGWLCHCLQPPRVTRDCWQSWETDWELARVGWSAHTKTCLRWYILHWELPDHACSLKNQCDLFLDLTAEHWERPSVTSQHLTEDKWHDGDLNHPPCWQDPRGKDIPTQITAGKNISCSPDNKFLQFCWWEATWSQFIAPRWR